MKRHILLCLLLIFACSLLPAFDFGLVLDQTVDYSGFGNDTAFLYKGILVPRVSGLFGENGAFIFSAGLNYQNDPWALAPELLHTEISWRLGITDFRMGRMDYSDPLGYVATGLFDGMRISFDTPAGLFSVGGWYTGLLLKSRVNIEMTEDEWTLNNSPINYSDFVNTYFAPRRVLAALDWEHPGLAERILTKFSAIGQFDLSGEDLNSHYLLGKMTIPIGAFAFELGGCFELIQYRGNLDTAFAAEAGFSWKGAMQGLHLMGRYASGETDSMAAFLPVTSNLHGFVWKPKLSGLSVISLDYTARFHRTFAFGLSPNYYMFNGSGFDKRLLGGEAFAALYWSPVSDISINLGGGAFMPSLGNVAPDEKIFWRVELNMIISIF